MKLKSTLLYITAATLTFSSCQIGKHYTRPELNLPEQLDSTQQDTLTIAEMQWWEIYTDTTLQNLIDKTLEHNKDIKMAAARVKELAAMKRIDFANLFPQLNGSVYTQKGLPIMEATNTATIPRQEPKPLSAGKWTCGVTSAGQKTKVWLTFWEA